MDIILSGIVALLLVLFTDAKFPALNIGNNVTGIAYGLAAFFLLRLIVALIKLPAEIYIEQGGFIKNPFDVSAKDSNGEWASIKVKNKSSIANVEDCFLELHGITDTETDQPIAFEPQNLTWSGREQNSKRKGDEPTTLIFDSPRWCDVAHIAPGEQQANLTLWFRDDSAQARLKEGKYRLKIKVHGKWKGFPVNYSYFIDLTFRLPDNLKIGKIEELRTS